MRLAIALAAILAVSSSAQAGTITVQVDKSTRIALNRPARNLVIANPKVADVSLIDARNIVILGKDFGTTSLLVLDATGRTILDNEIVVSSPSVGAVSFYRGAQVQSFTCDVRCEPTSDAPTIAGASKPAGQ